MLCQLHFLGISKFSHNMSDEVYLITGATGFVGSNIVRRLVALGKKVSILLRDKKHTWRIEDVLQKVQIIETDLLSSSLKNDLAGLRPTYIFHLAAYGALPQESFVDKIIDVNLKGTLNLIDAVKKEECKLFINTGSSSEYGIKEKPMEESDVVEPLNDYGVTKVAVTLFCQKIARTESLPIVTLRLFSPYGYFEEGSRLIPSVILRALENKPVDVSSLSNVRDFVFIDDVVDAYIKVLLYLPEPGTIINIGSGKQHRIEDVVHTVLRITKSNSKIRLGKTQKQVRQIEPKMWQADIRKAKKVLKWEPKYTLADGLEKTVLWFQQYKHLYA